VSPGDNERNSRTEVIYRSIIAWLWLLFVVYWAVAPVGAKRNASGLLWRRGIGLRLVAMLLIVAVLRSPSLREFLAETQRAASHSAILGWIGVALCLLGFGLGVYARWHLGRNWGMPMSHKDQPELVTSGPYAFIRHPIYTGLILAMLGSAIGANVSWGLLPGAVYRLHGTNRDARAPLIPAALSGRGVATNLKQTNLAVNGQQRCSPRVDITRWSVALLNLAHGIAKKCKGPGAP
jgi:protein-S-isoprenylcysteine O-methyltransferase Ste14